MSALRALGDVTFCLSIEVIVLPAPRPAAATGGGG
jgi:hypothetical protein